MRHSGLMEKGRVPILIISGVFFILSAVILMNLERPPGASNPRVISSASHLASAPAAAQPAAASTPSKTAVSEAAVSEAAASKPAEPAPPTVTPPSESAVASPVLGAVGEADLIALKTKNLLIPVAGMNASQLRDNFTDGRSEGRQHNALDIMAPQGAPVLAVADGTVVRLFQSDKGGTTLYQSDSSGLYFFYYAHLMRYADGITEGQQVKRGDVIGYVGDTGNAGAGNFHLHFSISKPATPGKWSGGEPINPYPLLTGK